MLYANDGGSAAGYADVSITNSLFTSAFTAGLASVGNTRQGMFSNVYVGFCTAHDNPGYNKPSNWSGSGIVLGNTNVGTIEYCLAHDNGSASFHAGGGPCGIWTYESAQVTIQFCEVFNQRTLGSGDGCAFDIDGGSSGCIVQYCYGHDNDGAGVLMSSFTGQSQDVIGNIVRFNILQNNARRDEAELSTYFVSNQNYFYHNTCYTRTNPPNGRLAVNSVLACVSVGAFGHDTKGIPQFFNNVFYVDDGATHFYIDADVPGTPAFCNNAYWSGSGTFSGSWNGTSFTTLAAFQTATSQEKRNGAVEGIFADPALAAPGLGTAISDPQNMAHLVPQYDPAASSPLRRAALDITSDYGLAVGAIDFHRKALSTGAALTLGAVQLG